MNAHAHNAAITQLIGLLFVGIGTLCVGASIRIYRQGKSRLKICFFLGGLLTAILFLFYGLFLLLVG
jgi:hypothetical protein